MVRQSQGRTVIVLDDDIQCIEFTTKLLEPQGYCVEAFTLPDAAIGALSHRDRRDESVLVLDVQMPTVDGLEVIDTLNQQGVSMPVIYTTSNADVPTVVAAMDKDAVTLLQKPLDGAALGRALGAAFSNGVQLRRSIRTNAGEYIRTQERLGSLTKRESQIVRGLLADLSNVEIASEFNISIKTVELYRSKVMSKLEAKNAAHLVRMVMSHKFMCY